MTRMNVKEVRGKLRTLLDRVEAGDEVVITRRGKDVARVLPLESERPFPNLAGFRQSLRVKGEPLSKTIIRMRREARY